MDATADALVARAAHRLGSGMDGLIAEVERCLRGEVPELWDAPDIGRMTSENIAEHITGVLTDLAQGIEPIRIVPPSADAERARRLARHGISVSALLRAHRLAQGIVIDRMLAELPALTDDTALAAAAARRMIKTGTRYVDRSSEQGVAAFQEERDRRLRWRLSLVNEASRCVGTTLDIARTTQELADVVVEHFADSVTVDLLDSVLRGHETAEEDPPVVCRVARRSVAETEAVADDDVPDGAHTFPVGSPPARALATGQPSRHHPREAPAPDGPPADRDHVHSTLVVPLCARGITLGVAQFFRYRDPDLFDDEDLLLAQEIATRAAVAVDNARRYTHARAAALALQRSLLPRRSPRQSAVDVAWRYLPAGPEAGVGGDWYDVIPLSGARVALVVGDVVGHGVHAAATMGRLRTAVRTLADIDLPPDELLTHLDDVVLRLSAEASDEPSEDPSDEPGAAGDAGDGDIGATCLYVVYDPVSRRCAMARAGHVLPAALRPDGTAEILDLPPGPPLGLGGLPFEAAEFDLPEGSLLALYTDGLIEARDHDVDAGLARLRHVLTHSGPSLEATCDRVLDALLPARPEDDVALLLARTRVLTERQVAGWELDADPASVAAARSGVARQLSAWGLEELDFTTELVVSELVTNAIRHGRPPIRLRLIHDRSLLCEVSDSGSTTPHLRRARTFDEGGRGLFLVAQLADRWGTRHARYGKTVWAELNESDGFPAALAFA